MTGQSSELAWEVAQGILKAALARYAAQARLEATQAAKELARLLTLEQLQSVSKPTAEWIAENFNLERAAGEGLEGK